MKNFISIYLLFFAALTFFSCSKEEIGLEATATGFVKIYNEEGKEQYDRAGIQVRTTDGSSSATTDEMGKYLLTGLKLGKNYDIEISREGYGSTKTYNNVFLKGPKSNLIYSQYLYQQPTFKVTNFTFTVQNNALVFDADITPVKFYSIQMFLNDSSNVSNSRYDYKSYVASGSSSAGFNNIIIGCNLPAIKYNSGTTVYAVVYFYNFSDRMYYNADLKEYVFSSAVKGSDIMTIKIP